jgi:hypothetical protein
MPALLKASRYGRTTSARIADRLGGGVNWHAARLRRPLGGPQIADMRLRRQAVSMNWSMASRRLQRARPAASS